MPIYAVRTVNFKTKVDSFARRGLDNHASSKVSELAITSVSPKPIQNVIRFSHMSSELHGRKEGHYQVYEEKPRAVLRRYSGESPFEGPQLIVEMKSGGDVLNGLGLFEVATSKQAIYGGQPTIKDFASICQLGTDFYQNIPAGNVNIAGYIAWIQAWRGIHAFYAVGGGEIGEGGPLNMYVSEEGAKKVKAPREAQTAQIGEDGELIAEGRQAVQGGGWIAMDRKYVKVVSGAKPALDGIMSIEASAGDLDFKGLLFPYFREMLEADVDFAYSVFSNLYSLCLEDGEGPTSEAITVHRRGFRYLANTQAGKIVQHIYLGIKLSIETGAGLVLVLDGNEYAGFMLKGEDFRIAIQNRVYTALSEKDLSAELSALDVHNQTLVKIFDLLMKVDRIGGGEEIRTVEMMKRNPRVLREMVQARTPEGIDSIRAELAKLIPDLKYHQTFWDINQANLSKFMEAMSYKYPTIDEPMYIHIDVLANRSSDILSYLSVFGVQAPSIYHGSKTMGVPRPDAQDPNLEVTDGRRKVPHIPFVNKGLAAAAADWATTYKTKSFRFTPAEAKFGGKGFSSGKKRDGFVASPEFDAFYPNLKKWMYTGVEKPAKVVIKKRKSGDDATTADEEMEEAPRKKTKFVFL